MRVIASCGAMREVIVRQESRPAIVCRSQITLLESDFGGQGLNRGQLAVLSEEVPPRSRPLRPDRPAPEVRERGRRGAGCWIASKTALPTGAHGLGIIRPRVPGRLARLRRVAVSPASCSIRSSSASASSN